MPIATPTTEHPQQVTTILHDQKLTLQTASQQKTLTVPSSIVLLQATEIPSVIETAVPPTSVQAAAGVSSTNRLMMLQTPTPGNGQDGTGEQSEQEDGSTSSAALSSVSVTLIAVCISILVVVSITLVAVCLLYRRRYGDKLKRKKPSVVQEDTHRAQDSYPLEAPCKSELVTAAIM